MKNKTLIIILFITVNIFAQSTYIVINHAGGTKKYVLSQVTNITFETHNCGESLDYSGKTYNTVLIGSQCWMKENLNIGTRIDGTVDQTSTVTAIEKYCYNDLESNCDLYGGLYQWNEAMNYVTTAGAQGICPDGWHIPTYAELQALGTAVGSSSNALKAVGQGTGDGVGQNTSGFSALLAGNRGYSTGDFSSLGSFTYFWSSTERSSNDAYFLYLYYGTDTVYFNYNPKGMGFSIRCLRD